MCIIGFDGLISAGKTTTIKKLSRLLNATVVEEFGSYIKRSGSGFPSFPPNSCEMAIEASKYFVRIEQQRILDLSKENSPNLVLVDRTYLSCLGFDFALQHFTEINMYDEAFDLWMKNPRINCDITFFLDVSHNNLEQRIAPNKDKFLPHLYNKEFNSYITKFLLQEYKKNDSIVKIDANQCIERIQQQVFHYINLLVDH